MNEVLKYALYTAKNGIKVFPLASIDSKRNCTCFKGKNCQQIAKHPILAGSWKKYATTDEQTIKSWFENGKYNFALVVPDNYVVVDVDPKNGGDLALANFEKEFGKLTHTVEVKTGSGGRHLFYLKPKQLAGVHVKNREIIRGVDIKAAGGYLVGVGSNHKSGNKYIQAGVMGFDLTKVQELQHEDLIKLLNPQKKASKENHQSSVKPIIDVGFTDGKVAEGSRNHFLFALACSLRGRGFFEDQILGALRVINSLHCTPSLSEDEVILCSKSAARYAVGAASPEKPKYSMNDACFDGALGEVVRIISEHTESSAIGVLCTLLTICGNAMGRKVKLDVGNMNHASNLFLILVGSTSKGRKGTSYNVAREVSQQFIDSSWFSRVETGLASGEGLIQAVRDKKTILNEKGQDVTIDEGTKDKRLLIYEPEVSKVLRVAKREGNTVSQILRQAWDGGRIQSLSKASPQVATGHHISMIGHITNHELLTEIELNDIFNGFANRCLWVYVERERLLPLGGSIIDFLCDYKKLEGIFYEPSERTSLKLSEKAKPVWTQIYQSHNTSFDTQDEKLNALEARGTDHILRLALIYAYADRATEISPQHLHSAQSIWNYCRLSIAYVFGTKAQYASRVEEKILELFNNRTELTRTQIRDGLNRNSSSKEINEIRQRLLEKDLIQVDFKDGTEVWTKKIDNSINSH